jgi:outer membrane protein assembly factor BamB
VTKWVAVKEMINPSHDPEMRETMVRNFEREANILATLSHPSIPRIYDFFTHSQSSYLVLEFIHGDDLENILRKSTEFIGQEQIVAWAIELCDVLAFLHTHIPEPIIFRDIKPSNIMINQYNHVVLVDFGIAKAFNAGQRGTMMGTEGYSPPEQYRGEESPVVDIYAIGATLHHLLTRCNPQHETPFTFPERPIRQYNRAVSPDLEQVVDHALQYMAEDRYQTAEEMKEALLAVQAKLKSTTVPVPVNTSAAASGSHDEGSKPTWIFDCEDEVRGTPTWGDGVLYAGSYDNNLYALDASTGEYLWKYRAQGAVVSRPAVVDSFVYFGSEDGNLYVLSSLTGRLLWSYRTNGPVRSSPACSGQNVFIGSDDGRMHAINVKTGRKIWAFDAGSQVRSSAVTEGNLVYFGSERGDFYCVDVIGAQKWHYHAKRAVTSTPAVKDGQVYFGSMDSTLYAFDARMGWESWRFRLGKGTISTPCLVDKYLYTGSVDGKITCVEITSTREVWSVQTEHQVTGSPANYEDLIFCGSVDGKMYGLDYKTGRERWKYDTGSPITGTPIVAEGMLYFGSTNHRLYAFSIG